MGIYTGLRVATALLLISLPSPVLAQTSDPNFKTGGAVLSSSASPAPAAAATAAPASGRLQIPQLQLTSQVAFGRPVDSLTRFAPTQAAIYAWFTYASATPGTELIGRLVLLAPAGEIEARTLKTALAKTDDAGSFTFSVEPDTWPEGRYRLDLQSGGTKVRSIEFDVRK